MLKEFSRFSSLKLQELSALVCISLTIIALSQPLAVYESLENQINQWSQGFPSDSFHVMLLSRQFVTDVAVQKGQGIEGLPLFAPPETQSLDASISVPVGVSSISWFTSERLNTIRQLPYITTIAWARGYADELYFKDKSYVINLVSPDFFELAGFKIAQGRSPTSEDSSQVAVVGDQAYQILFDSTQGVGQSFVPDSGGYEKELTIIGVLEPAGGIYAQFSEGIDQAIYILDQEPIDVLPGMRPTGSPITEIWVKPAIGKQHEAINAVRSYLQKELGEDTVAYILTNQDYVRFIGGIQARQTYVPGMNWVIGLLALVAVLNSSLVIYTLLVRRRFGFGIRRALGLTRSALILEDAPALLMKGFIASALGILIGAVLAPFVGNAIQPLEFYTPIRIELGIYTVIVGLIVGIFSWFFIACLTMLFFLRKAPAALIREKHVSFGSGEKEKWLSGLGFTMGVFALLIILGLRDGTISQFDRILGWAGGERAGAIVDWLAFDSQHNGKPAELSTFDYLQLKKKFPGATFGWIGRTGGLPGISKLETSSSIEEIRPPVLVEGRWISLSEEETHAHVAVLGLDIASRLAKERDISVANLIGQMWESYEIIGVMDEWPARYSMGFRLDVAYVPIGTVDPGDEYYYPKGQIAFIAPPGMKLSIFLDQLRSAFETYHREGTPQFILPTEKISEMLAWRIRIYTLMGLFAVIVLIIGGVGIMNILLMMVINRWREIGIRRSIGASRWEIIGMVLAQAFQTTLFATLCGGLAGTGIVLLMQHQFNWPVTIYPYWLAVCIGIALFSALIFGSIPAWWAASRAPTEMLRME